MVAWGFPDLSSMCCQTPVISCAKIEPALNIELKIMIEETIFLSIRNALRCYILVKKYAM